MAGFDWRPSPGYARRGGLYAVTLHDYRDSNENFGFRQIDYDVVQHLPLLREAWVLSLHAFAATTDTKVDQRIPFFMNRPMLKPIAAVKPITNSSRQPTCRGR